MADDGDDVFVGAIGADVEGVAEAVGDALDEVAELGFVDGVGWGCCILVEESVFLGEGVGRVYSIVKYEIWKVVIR